MEHRHSLDGLRGLAVAAVVVYHFAPKLLPAGFLGVDLFFVLSGFLITSLLLAERRRTGRVDVKAFWGRRARRLLPAALLALAGIAVYSSIAANAAANLKNELLASLFYANNWQQIADGQSYFALFAAPSPTKHFWSLAIEEQFYLVWPLLFLGGITLLARLPERHRSRSRLVAGIAIGAVALASAGWMWHLYSPLGDPTRVYYGTDTRAFELLIGVLLAVVVGSPERVKRRAAMSGIGAVAAVGCIAAMFVWSETSAFYYQGGALLWAVGIAFVIVSLLPFGGPVSAAFGVAPLRLLGVISYGVYLFHFPVMVWVTEESVGRSGAWLFALRVAITLLIATISFFLIESPIRRRRVLPPGLPAKLMAPAAAAFVLLLIVIVVAPASDRPALPEAAAEGPPNTEIVFSQGESAGGGPPTTSEMEAIYTMAAYDASEKAKANPTAPPPPPTWVPPPVPPQAPRKQATLQADISLVTSCAGKQMPPLAEYRNNGTGKLVAVIGDSMTSQMRQTILNDRRYDWFLLARCGTAVYHFDHLDARGADGIAEAFAKLLFLQPKALIINLGITDVSRKLDYVPSMHTLIDLTKNVPCRSWVTLWPNPGVENYMPGGIEMFQKFDDELAGAVKGTDIKLLDWGARATQIPENEYGYHPWLNPTDWVHLLPGQGFEQRHLLMTSGLEGCF